MVCFKENLRYISRLHTKVAIFKNPLHEHQIYSSSRYLCTIWCYYHKDLCRQVNFVQNRQHLLRPIGFDKVKWKVFYLPLLVGISKKNWYYIANQKMLRFFRNSFIWNIYKFPIIRWNSNGPVKCVCLLGEYSINFSKFFKIN